METPTEQLNQFSDAMDIIISRLNLTSDVKKTLVDLFKEKTQGRNKEKFKMLLSFLLWEYLVSIKGENFSKDAIIEELNTYRDKSGEVLKQYLATLGLNNGVRVNDFRIFIDYAVSEDGNIPNPLVEG